MMSAVPGAALLASPVRRAIAEALADPDILAEPGGPAGREGPPRAALTAAQLASRVGLHVTTVRFHLDQLVAAGVVEASFVRTGAAGRPRKVYALDRRAGRGAAGGESLRLLTALLTRAFAAAGSGAEVTPEQAGAEWAAEHVVVPARPAGPGEPRAGDAAHRAPDPAATPGEWLAKVGRMLDVLREWGYSPELSTSEGGSVARVDLDHCPFRDLARENPAVICGIHTGLIAGTMAALGEDETEVGLTPFVEPGLCVARLRRART
jgi:predicted ArsR family transcriptional regulator